MNDADAASDLKLIREMIEGTKRSVADSWPLEALSLSGGGGSRLQVRRYWTTILRER